MYNPKLFRAVPSGKASQCVLPERGEADEKKRYESTRFWLCALHCVPLISGDKKRHDKALNL